MSVEKPCLKVALFDREQKSQPRLMLDVEDQDAVILSELPQSIVGGEKNLGNGLGERVKGQVKNPVEHFNKKGPFGQDSRVPIVGEARRIGSSDGYATTIPFLRGILCRIEDVRFRRKRVGIEGAIGGRPLRVVMR
jgi:hypothetical protein